VDTEPNQEAKDGASLGDRAGDAPDLFVDSQEWLRSLVQIMNQNEVVEISIEDRGRCVRLRKSDPAPLQGPTIVAQAPVVAAAPGALQQGAEIAGGTVLPTGVTEITSPMVGTFYRAPSPEADSFVEVGGEVVESTTLCIIEAMKVMNEIKAEVTGTIEEILVSSGEAVEYGQPLMRIKIA
jgi:acetyl-CoA carboxylase biotin carboxyl carrier protein